MTTSKDLRNGVGQALDVAGVGTFRPNGGYQTGDSAPVYFNRMPDSGDSTIFVPDRCIVVTIYPLGADHLVGVQVRVRGAAGGATSAEDLADAVRAALHGLHDQAWGDTTLVLLAFTYAARMGADAAGRDEVSLNFQATTSDPSTSLVDLD